MVNITNENKLFKIIRSHWLNLCKTLKSYLFQKHFIMVSNGTPKIFSNTKRLYHNSIFKSCYISSYFWVCLISETCSSINYWTVLISSFLFHKIGFLSIPMKYKVGRPLGLKFDTSLPELSTFTNTKLPNYFKYIINIS